jgi:hypothetical protein
MIDNMIPEKGVRLQTFESLGGSIGNQNPLNAPRLVNKHEAADLIGVSPETLKKYRLQEDSTLIEGIHYHVWNSRTIRYNALLMADWGLHRNNPAPPINRRLMPIWLACLVTNPSDGGGRQAND